MPHLVQPHDARRDGRVPVAEYARQLQVAHEYLVKHGKRALGEAHRLKAGSYWGTTVKRVLVGFTDPRPALITQQVREHNLTEVHNQCATIERLLDALAWVQPSETLLSKYILERCHPTTNTLKAAGRTDGVDNDLVLSDSADTQAQCEVSDVIGRRDGNR